MSEVKVTTVNTVKGKFLALAQRAVGGVLELRAGVDPILNDPHFSATAFGDTAQEAERAAIARLEYCK